MPKLWTTELLRLLTQLGINTEEKPDIVSNKKKLIRLIQKAYEDVMDGVDKEPEERKTTLQDLRFFVKNFEGNNTCVGLPGNNVRTNEQQQQTLPDVTYDNGTSQQHQQQNQYDVGKTDASTDAAATSMTYMLSIRELAYLNQTSLSLKNFKIRGVIGNTG